MPQASLGLLGATHTADLPFVFGVFDNFPGGGNCTLNATEQALSGFVQRAWTHMAASSNPGDGWPLFSANDSQGMIFGNEAKVGKVDYSVCDFWDKIGDEVAATAANQTSQSPTSSTNTPAIPTKMNGSPMHGVAWHVSLLCALFAILATILY